MNTNAARRQRFNRVGVCIVFSIVVGIVVFQYARQSPEDYSPLVERARVDELARIQLRTEIQVRNLEREFVRDYLNQCLNDEAEAWRRKMVVLRTSQLTEPETFRLMESAREKLSAMFADAGLYSPVDDPKWLASNPFEGSTSLK